MLLFEAKASLVAQFVFKAARSTRKLFAADVDDLISVDRLYVSCDGNLLFASKKETSTEIVNIEAVPEERLQIVNDSSQIDQIAFESDGASAWTEADDDVYEGTILADIAELVDKEEEWNETTNWDTGSLEHDGHFIVEEPEYTKPNHGDWIVHPNWATQPFGWDDNEIVEYSEPEEYEDDASERIKTRIHVEDVPYAVQRDDGTFECSKCNDGRTFQFIYNVSRHAEQHRERNSICSCCGDNFDWRRIPQHEFYCRTAPPPKEKIIICESNKTIKKSNRSVRGYIDVRGATCPECGKGKFRSPIEYFDHLNTHSGEQPYICSCGKSRTRQYANFWHHRRKNKCPLEGCSYPEYAEKTVLKISSKKPKSFKNAKGEMISNYTGQIMQPRRRYPDGHICEHCNKRCLNASVLALHRAEHHMERTIPCPEEGCDKMFPNQRLLKKHVKSHLFINKCDLCDMVFRVRMRHHMLIYHPKFHCKPCCFKSMGRARYENHLKSEKHKSRCGEYGSECTDAVQEEKEPVAESEAFEFVDGSVEF